jgi:hypothetical protein
VRVLDGRAAPVQRIATLCVECRSASHFDFFSSPVRGKLRVGGRT